MRKLSGLLVVVMLIFTASSSLRGDEKDEANKKEMKKFEGLWQMVRQESNARVNRDANRHTILFEGSNYTFLRDKTNKVSSATFVIDSSTDPKSFNLSGAGGTSRYSLGIYRFVDDDNLEICLNQPRGANADKRPTKFTTIPDVGSGSILYVLKRIKPEKENK